MKFLFILTLFFMSHLSLQSQCHAVADTNKIIDTYTIDNEIVYLPIDDIDLEFYTMYDILYVAYEDQYYTLLSESVGLILVCESYIEVIENISLLSSAPIVTEGGGELESFENIIKIYHDIINENKNN